MVDFFECPSCGLGCGIDERVCDYCGSRIQPQPRPIALVGVVLAVVLAMVLASRAWAADGELMVPCVIGSTYELGEYCVLRDVSTSPALLGPSPRFTCARRLRGTPGTMECWPDWPSMALGATVGELQSLRLAPGYAMTCNARGCTVLNAANADRRLSVWPPSCTPVHDGDELRCLQPAPMPSNTNEGLSAECAPVVKRALEAAQKLVRDPDDPPSFVTTTEYRPPCMATCQLEERRQAIADQKEAARLLADALGCMR